MRKHTWLALNGVERVEHAGAAAVVYPWDDVGLRLTDLGWPAGAKKPAVRMALPGALNGLAVRLKARALRRRMVRGEEFWFDCRSRDELGPVVFFFVFAVVLGAVAAFAPRTHSTSFLVLAGFCVLIALPWLWALRRRNVLELTISERGVDALLRGGEHVKVSWRELDRSNLRRGSRLRSVNGLDLRFKTTRELRAALMAARALKPVARRAEMAEIRRVTWFWLGASVVLSAAGAAVWWWFGLQQHTTWTPMMAFLRMTGMTASMGVLAMLQVYLRGPFEAWTLGAAVKVYSEALVVRDEQASGEGLEAGTAEAADAR